MPRFFADNLNILKAFQEDAPVEGARALNLIDDIAVIMPQEKVLDMRIFTTVTLWPEGECLALGVSPNRAKLAKSQVLPSRTEIGDLTGDEEASVPATNL